MSKLVSHSGLDLRPRGKPRAYALAVFTSLLPLMAASVRAEPGVTLNQYRAPALSSDAFSVARPELRPHLHLETRLSLDYARDPLVYETRRGSASTERTALVSDQLTAQLAVSFSLVDRLLLFLGLPVDLLMEGQKLGMQPTATGAGIGDLGFGVRGLLVRGAPFALGLQLSATVPTGKDNPDAPAVARDAGPTLLSSALGELAMGPLSFGFDVGIRARKPVQLPGARVDTQLLYAAALNLPLAEGLVRISAEAFGSTLSADAGLRQTSPLEVLLGLKLRPNPAWSIGLAGTKGILRGYGTPSFRVIAQVAFHFAVAEAGPEQPVETTLQPTEAEPEPEPRVTLAAVSVDEPEAPEPAKDRDQDGLIDDADACPALPGAAEDNGCPEHLAYTRGTGALTLTPPPTFKTGTATLAPRNLSALESLARTLASHPQLRVFTTVHLDPKLQPLAQLGEQRARVLAAWLIERGVKAKQLDFYDCGVQRPGSSGPRQRAVHERSEWFLVTPLPEQGMPSSLRCHAVALSAAEAASGALAAPAPEPDRDGDGLSGANDRCPLDPGTPATQGCSKDVHVDLEAGRIELLRPVTFSGRTLKSKRTPLKAAAQVLKQQAEFRVEIRARAAGASKDARVACKQASAVQAYLVAQGVAAERLAAHGCGAPAPATNEKKVVIDLLLLDPAPKSGVRSNAGCVPCE